MEKLEEMMKEIKYFFVGEEYLFTNILSDDQEISESIESDSLIYDDWSKPDLGTPRYLTEEDIPEIKKSGKLFIRKAGNKTDVSRILLSHLYKYHFWWMTYDAYSKVPGRLWQSAFSAGSV